MHNLFILGGLSIQITPLLCLLVAGVFGIVVFVRGKHIEGKKTQCNNNKNQWGVGTVPRNCFTILIFLNVVYAY